MSRKKFLCLDCGVDTGKIHDYYMLTDEVWNQVHNSKFGMLCVPCVENRLGRELEPDDFNDSYVNRPDTVSKSNVLMSRINKEKV